MNLSNEDNLRLNVLLHQDLHAVRIDESKMIVYGLSDKGEAKIELKPNCKDETYLKQVRELISTHVLGSPGGYPIFLRRWTRMGQSRTQESLERLLLLGEPEAIVAVVNADEVTNEIARYAWWAMPTAANARGLLKHQDVVNGDMGKILADFLVEFLPFEEDPHDMIESARLVLQKDLVDDTVKRNLWKKGQRKNALLVGFMKSVPDDLPLNVKDHKDYGSICNKLSSLESNIYARLLRKIYSSSGQAYLQTVKTVMNKPSNQDVVILLFNTVKEYFESVCPNNVNYLDIEDVMADASKYTASNAVQNDDMKAILQLLPELSQSIQSMIALSLIGESLLNPVFSRTDAIGTLMRKKIAHITSPLIEEVGNLINIG